MTSRRAVTACLLLAGYLALALVFTYPLAWHFGTHYVGEASGDAKVYLWSYWWVKKALFELGTTPFQTDYIFHPIGIGLALHTLAPAQGLVLAPLGALLGDVAAVNALVLWTFVASALTTYALARQIGAGPAGAFLAGLAFAFCPYRLARLAGHYDLLGTEWIPLYILLLLRLSEAGRFRPLLAVSTGLVAAVGAYTAVSYAVFLGLFTIVFLLYRRERALFFRTSAVAAVLALATAPLWLHALRDLASWSYPAYPGADRYVTDLAALVVPPPGQTFLPGRAFSDNLTETTVFPGYLLLVLAAFGRKRRLWTICAVVFFVLSLGSSLHIGGTDTGVPLPFWILSQIPILDNLRAPSRFSILMVLALAMMMACAWAPKRRFWTPLVAAVFVAEYLAAPIPLFRESRNPIYEAIARDDAAVTVVEVPGIEQSPAEIMDHQRTHGKPIFIGTAARVPREKSEYYFGLPLVRPLIDVRKGRLEVTTALLERERMAAPAVARFLGLGYFVLDKAYDKRGVRDFVQTVLPVETTYEDEDVVVLRTKREQLPPNPTRIDAGALASRLHFESGWLRPETEDDRSFRWAHRRRSTLLFRRPQGAQQVVLVLAPLDGARQEVRAELDGRPLGTYPLPPGWGELAFGLPAPARDVERLTLHWAVLERASARDPRRLAARVRELRFERVEASP